MSEKPSDYWRRIPGHPTYYLGRNGEVKREIPVAVRRGSVDLRTGIGRKSASVRALHKALWPELWTEPDLSKMLDGEPTLARSRRMPPDLTKAVSWEGVLVDLDGRLIDEGGYFVNYAGERVLEPVQGEPDPEAGE